MKARTRRDVDAIHIAHAYTSKGSFEPEDKQTFLVTMVALEMIVFNFVAMFVSACAI